MFSIFLLLFACPQSRIDDADPSGMPYCDETSQSIDRDDDSGIGIPASDLLDALPFAEELALSWAEGAEDSLAWSFQADESTLVLIQSQAVYPETNGPVPLIDVECSDYLSVAGTLSLASADGRLQEELEITLKISGGGMASEGPLAIVSEELEISDLQGEIDTGDYIDPSEYDTVSLRLGGEIYFGDEMLEFVGQLRGRGEKTEGQFATLESFDIASWGPASAEQ